MNWFEEVSRITKMAQTQLDSLDCPALRGPISPQAQAAPRDLVLRHQGHLVLRMSGVDKIFVPLSRSNAEMLTEASSSSDLLEIQIAPSTTEA